MAAMLDASHWLAHYQPGVPAQIDVPTESLATLIDHAAEQAPDHLATSFFGATMTYAQLGTAVSRAAEGLRRLGVRAGDRVALILPNCPQHIIAFYAILRLGAIVVEHNPLYTPRELRHMFEDHTARVAICWDHAVEKLRSQPDDIGLEHTIAVNLLDAFPSSLRFALRLPIPSLRSKRAALTAKAPGAIPWRKFLHNPGLDPAHPYPEASDLAAIQYTSGTTGVPKGAMLTHANLYSNALQAWVWFPDMTQRTEVIYSVLPMFHAFGLTLALTLGVLIQAQVVLFPTVDASMIISAAKRTPPTVLGGVPPIFHVVGAMAKRKRVSLATARFCFCGAMNLPEETAATWEKQTGVPLIEGYGMTEASPVLCGNPANALRPGSVGVPFPSTEVKVVEVDDPTREVALGERGELLARGPQVFCGYWNNPEETDRTLLPGGWLRTGDIVTQAADGYLTIVDRVKELIITGGFNVAPTEVETILKSHPDVHDAAVVGVPLPVGGERVSAAVVLRDGTRFDAEELRRYCKARLAAYKVPKLIVAMDDLPKSLLGKVLRGQVRDMLIDSHVTA